MVFAHEVAKAFEIVYIGAFRIQSFTLSQHGKGLFIIAQFLVADPHVRIDAGDVLVRRRQFTGPGKM